MAEVTDILTASEAEGIRRTLENVPNRPAMADIRAALLSTYTFQRNLIAGEAQRKIRERENAECHAKIRAMGDGVLDATAAGWNRLRDLNPNLDRVARKGEPPIDKFDDLPVKAQIRYAEFMAAGLAKANSADGDGLRRFPFAEDVPRGVKFKPQNPLLATEGRVFIRVDEPGNRRSYARIQENGRPAHGWFDKNRLDAYTLKPVGQQGVGLNVDKFAPFVEVKG